jgi:antitoxin HigA-1
MALEMHPSLASHVDEWMKTEIVAPHGITVKALAAHLGVSRQGFGNLLNGHASPSPDMALRLEKAFGIKAETLLRLQLAHDLAQLRADDGDMRVGRIAEAA